MFNAELVDTQIGKRLKSQRMRLGISQVELADKVGLTFQQIQKYESGKNRISSSRLYQFTKLLDINPMYFFDDLEMIQNQDFSENNIQDPEISRQSADLLRCFCKIEDPKIRSKILSIVKAMAEE